MQNQFALGKSGPDLSRPGYAQSKQVVYQMHSRKRNISPRNKQETLEAIQTGGAGLPMRDVLTLANGEASR
jgi:hypothetical protein